MSPIFPEQQRLRFPFWAQLLLGCSGVYRARATNDRSTLSQLTLLKLSEATASFAGAMQICTSASANLLLECRARSRVPILHALASPYGTRRHCWALEPLTRGGSISYVPEVWQTAHRPWNRHESSAGHGRLCYLSGHVSVAHALAPSQHASIGLDY